MALFDQINEDIKQAMREKNKVKLEALRGVKSELLLLKTSGSASEITEEQEVKLIQKMVKQRKDSAEIFKTQGRDELYQNEAEQISYLENYLPEQMSDAQLSQAVAQIIERLGASSMKDMGKVMGTASQELAGKIDGKSISEKVKQLLNR